MALAEFEEKTFEQPLNHQLLGRNRKLFPPGQVLEHLAGYDAALVSTYPYFWQLWRRSNPPAGVNIATVASRAARRYLPASFRANLFIQHKRPQVMSRRSSKEWATWNRPYFRFDLMPHQQRALYAVARRAGHHALVCYASPAFGTVDELCKHIELGTLVQATNFARVTNFTGHRRYSYIAAGIGGYGHSEAEPIEPLVLEHEIQYLADLPPTRPPDAVGAGSTDDDNIIRKMGRAVHDEMANLPSSLELTRIYELLVQTLLTRLEERHPDDMQTIRGFVRVGIFCWLTSTAWFIVGSEPCEER